MYEAVMLDDSSPGILRYSARGSTAVVHCNITLDRGHGAELYTWVRARTHAIRQHSTTLYTHTHGTACSTLFDAVCDVWTALSIQLDHQTGTVANGRRNPALASIK